MADEPVITHAVLVDCGVTVCGRLVRTLHRIEAVTTDHEDVNCGDCIQYMPTSAGWADRSGEGGASR